MSNLGEQTDDSAHLRKLNSLEPLPDPAPLALVVMSQPESLTVQEITEFRHGILKVTKSAYEQLCPSGVYALCIRDIRDPQTGNLWPLGLLIMEDITNFMSESCLKLKELIVGVPEGYARNPNDTKSFSGYREKCILDEAVESLPIVHVTYFFNLAGLLSYIYEAVLMQKP